MPDKPKLPKADRKLIAKLPRKRRKRIERDLADIHEEIARREREKVAERREGGV